jgi:hypothetical protein
VSGFVSLALKNWDPSGLLIVSLSIKVWKTEREKGKISAQLRGSTYSIFGFGTSHLLRPNMTWGGGLMGWDQKMVIFADFYYCIHSNKVGVSKNVLT